MTGPEALAAIGEAWKRGSLFLWAITGALLVAGGGIFAAYQVWPGIIAPVWGALALITAASIFVLAITKTLQERSGRAVVLTEDVGASFWAYAENDGRPMTQITLRGWATNVTAKSVYLTDIRLRRPAAKVDPGFLLVVRESDGPTFSSQNPIPPDRRREISVTFFLKGRVGQPGRPITIKAQVRDNLRRWHSWTFVDLRRPEDRSGGPACGEPTRRSCFNRVQLKRRYGATSPFGVKGGALDLRKLPSGRLE